MSTTFPDQLQLRQRMYLQLESQSWMPKLMAGLLVVVIIAIVAIFMQSGFVRNLEDLRSVLDAIAKGFARDPVNGLLNLLVFVLLVGHLFYMHWAQRSERLVLTQAGIEYRSPLPSILLFLHPGWSLSWSQIRAVTLQNSPVGMGPQMIVLKLEGGTKTVKLYPWRWVDPQYFEPAKPWQEMRRQQKMTALETEQEVRSSPLLRYLVDVLPHLEVTRIGKFGDSAFALEKNPASLTIVVAFFVLVIYALADGLFLGTEIYADAVPLHWFIISGLASAAVAVLWMVRFDVPKVEGTIVALLFGAAVGAAAYPGTLRLNAFTDTGGLRTYEYILQPNLTLTPVESGPPDLAFPEYHEYWQQFKPGSTHQFLLRRGGLGFYQLNFVPVRKALRKYYQNKR